MLQRLVEIVVLLNALGVGAGFFFRRLRAQRRQSHLDYVRRLELENKMMDKSIEQMRVEK